MQHAPPDEVRQSDNVLNDVELALGRRKYVLLAMS
jgi:hypothetical protein